MCSSNGSVHSLSGHLLSVADCFMRTPSLHGYRGYLQEYKVQLREAVSCYVGGW